MHRTLSVGPQERIGRALTRGQVKLRLGQWSGPACWFAHRLHTVIAGLQSGHLGSPPFLARGETPLPLPLLQRIRSFYGCFFYALTGIFCSFSDLIACFLASTLAHVRGLF
jgi:hypothetical protein